MASSNPYQMTYPEFVSWATPLVATAQGRMEVRRALVGLVGYARQSPDQKAAQQAIKLLGADNFSDATLKELTELSTEVSEATEEQTAVATETKNTKDLELMRGIAAIAGSPEGRNALNKARAGAPLSPRERRDLRCA